MTKQFGGQVVLDDVSLELRSGEIVGVIGPNGSGKTTVLRLVAGQVPPDIGTVTRTRGMDVGYLAQEPEISLDNTLHDEVLSAFADVLAMERKLQSLSEQMAAQHDSPRLKELMRQYDRVTAEFTAAGGYSYEQRLNEILGGLGFSEADRQLPMHVLSGGQKCRAALAKLLLQDSSYLLLDEPTNHLDIDAVRWLEKFLAGHHGGAAIVSHDRYLLDRLAERMVEVDGRRLTSYPGDYSNYAHVRELRRVTQERQYQKDQAYIRKERDFIARHHYAQRSKEAQGRRKRLERRLERGEFVLQKPSSKRDIKLDFNRRDPSGGSQQASHRKDRVVLTLENVTKAFDDKTLFRELSLQVESGQRLGITGPNGTGKTTLLRLILSELPPDAGEIAVDMHAAIGYYAQEPHDLDSDTNVLGEILAGRPDFGEPEARSYLARFLFTDDDVFKPARSLSGGEQSRLRLAKLILKSPNVLMLDEPTNHLDIPSREALEQALAKYPGTIIAVSHDRYFLDRIASRLLVIRREEHGHVNGNYSDYIRQVEEEEAARQAAVEADRKAARNRSRKPAPAQARDNSRFRRLTLAELEDYITEHETRIRDIEAQFADPAVYRDGADMTALRVEFESLTREVAEAEADWEARMEEV